MHVIQVDDREGYISPAAMHEKAVEMLTERDARIARNAELDEIARGIVIVPQRVPSTLHTGAVVNTTAVSKHRAEKKASALERRKTRKARILAHKSKRNGDAS